MKKILSVLAVLCLTVVAFAQLPYVSVSGDPMKTRIYTLGNGLTVYLSPNHAKPEIQTFIAVRAGSQNDPLEATGMAHYQEHIMFKGTSEYGTTDYEQERPILEAIDKYYELYGQTTDPAERKAIYHIIDSLSYEGSKIAIANEFDKLMSLIGATGVNAFTSEEMTCYHEVIPSTELERWAMIERGRFTDLVVRGFHTELETVYEEFNMYSTMDQDKVMLAIDQILYNQVPYRQHTVLGTPEHLKNPNLKEIKKFYQTWYRPNNIAICLAGDFEYNDALAIVEQYFSEWEPNDNLPKFEQPEQKPLDEHRDTTVYGKESEQVWLAWQMPNVRSKDIPALRMMSYIMANGKCGLLDKDLTQTQRVLGVDDYLSTGNDFSTYYMIGEPKEGQTLEEVRDLMLAEVRKMCHGEFDEKLMDGVLNNMRRNKMSSLDNNRARVMDMVNSFIYQIPYDQVVNEMDFMAHLTHDDITLAAKKYLGDNYVCVFKRQGDQNYAAEVEKPEITPIEMNRNAESAFLRNLAQMSTRKMEPKFLDFKEDITRITTDQGIEILYVQNHDNELAYMRIILNGGYDQDPVLDLSAELLPYLGVQGKTVNQLQTELYLLAGETWVNSTSDETCLGIYGLNYNIDQVFSLLEQQVLTAQPDDKILKSLVKDNIMEHNNAKFDQSSSFNYLQQYGIFGAKTAQRSTLTPKQMNKLTSAQVLDHLRSLVPYIKRVEYYGPAELDVVKKMIEMSKIGNMANIKDMGEALHDQPEVITKSEIYIAPYKANNIYFMGYANWGETYDAKDEAYIQLFNEYFSGSMGSIVFQEMRESRALCYASQAYFNTPDYAGDNNYFATFILSQNDKMKDCIETFEQICNNLPLSESAFVQAKTSLLKRIEKRRYMGYQSIYAYVNMTKAGWTHDVYEDVYRQVQNMTLEDVVKWQQAHVANRTYRYLILGNSAKLDMNYLKTKGTIKKLKTKDIFVY